MDKQEMVDILLARINSVTFSGIEYSPEGLQALAEAAQALVALGYKWEDERFE